MKPLFKKEFERRMDNLVHAWTIYKTTGKDCSILPHLFKVITITHFNDVRLKK